MSTEEEALKLWRTTAVKTTLPKYLRREQRRAQPAKLSKLLNDGDNQEKSQAAYEDMRAAACMRSHPAGAMAPPNTTQYLMNNVYEDLRQQLENGCDSEMWLQLSPYDEALSPSCVYKALDSDHDSCLSFQQRDFEQEFGMLW